MIFALYLLALAVTLLAVNLRTFSSELTKRITYYGMWAAIAGSAIVAVKEQYL